MSQQILELSQVPKACPDLHSSPAWTRPLEATYAPLYKADTRTDALNIVSPFSQSLVISCPEESEAAGSRPPSMPVSTSLEGGIAEESRASSKDVVDAKLDAALHLSLSAPEPSTTPLQSASPEKSASPERPAKPAFAPLPPKAAAPSSQRAPCHRSISMKTAKSAQKARAAARQGKEMDDLNAALRYNMALQGRALQLERSVAFKDKQIGALTQEMRMLQVRQEEEESSIQRQIPLAREDPKAQSLPANLLRSACSASSLDLDAQLLRLQKLFDAHRLDEADATGHNVEEGVMRQLRELVKQGCHMAEEILTPSSACHHALPLIIMEHSSTLPDQATVWQAIVQKLRLSQAQKQQIATWQKTVHGHMQDVQKDRHGILSQMMHTLLPGGLLLHKDAPRMFSEQLLAQGTLPLMKVNMDAAATAKRLQTNLDQERALFAKANTMLLQSILSPIQAGLLMLDAWPAHCDCFAFATMALKEA